MTKIRLKLSNIELEFEGDVAEARAELMELVAEVIELNASVVSNASGKPNLGESDVNLDTDSDKGHQGKYDGSINTLAGKLRPKSCRDMMIASAAHLVLFQGKERFSKDEWVKLAQSANSWQAKWAPSTATVRTRLIDAGFVTEHSKDVFTLPIDSVQELEKKIGTL